MMEIDEDCSQHSELLSRAPEEAESTLDAETTTSKFERILGCTSPSLNRTRKRSANLLYARSKALMKLGSLDAALDATKEAIKSLDDTSQMKSDHDLFSGKLDQLQKRLQELLPHLTALHTLNAEGAQRRVLLIRSMRQVDRRGSPLHRISPELFLMIVDYLPRTDRTNAMLVCSAWRSVMLREPRLWRCLEIRLPKEFSVREEGLCTKFVQEFAARSKHTIERVEITPSIPDSMLLDVLRTLRKSASTLQHIALSTLYQKICYAELYQFCPELRHLDVTRTSSFHGSQLNLHGDEANFFPSSPMPFRLEVFRGDDNMNYGALFPHMSALRVLHNPRPGYPRPPSHKASPDVWRRYETKTEVFRSQFWRQLLSIRENLEEFSFTDTDWIQEWGDSDLIDGLEFVPEKIVFKNVKKLSGWTVGFPGSFQFPALEELTDCRTPSTMDPWDGGEEFDLWEFLQVSRGLRKFEMQMEGLNGEDHDYAMDTIADLPLLTELELTYDRYQETECEFIAQHFMPVAYFTQDEPKVRRVSFPCPQLKKLAIHGVEVDLKHMVDVVALRRFLAEGHTFVEAKKMMHAFLNPKRKKPDSETTESFDDNAIPEEKPAQIVPLQSLHLHVASGIDPGMERLLKRLVPDLRIEFCPLARRR